MEVIVHSGNSLRVKVRGIFKSDARSTATAVVSITNYFRLFFMQISDAMIKRFEVPVFHEQSKEEEREIQLLLGTTAETYPKLEFFLTLAKQGFGFQIKRASTGDIV